MINGKKENEIQSLEAAMKFYSEDFKTIKNIEKEKQKDLFKGATKVNEGMEIKIPLIIMEIKIPLIIPLIIGQLTIM